MTENELKSAIKSAAKTLNSRIRRLKNEDLPSNVDQRLKDQIKYKTGLVTPSGYVSGSTAGLTLKQLQSKLKWIKRVTSNTETVKQARENVERKAREWNVKKEEAARRIRAGRMFFQVLGSTRYKWDSTEVQEAIQEFDHTPTYDDLENKLFEKFGQDIQDTEEGADALLDWMNEHDIIPPGVNAHRENGKIVYDSDDEDNEV